MIGEPEMMLISASMDVRIALGMMLYTISFRFRAGFGTAVELLMLYTRTLTSQFEINIHPQGVTHHHKAAIHW